MEPTVYISPTPWFKRKLLWGFLLVLILIPIGAWIYATYFMKSPAPTIPAPAASKNTLEEENSPVAFDILLNPMVYEWRGSTEGTLIAKDDKSFTLSDKDNNKITIRIIASSKDITGTKFYKGEFEQNQDRRGFKEVTIDNISLGTKLHGDFFVFSHNKNELIGSSFNIVE